MKTFRRVVFWYAILWFSMVFAVSAQQVPAGPRLMEQRRTLEADRTATVLWSPNSETNLAGYRVWVGTASGVYTQSADVPVSDAPTYIFTAPSTATYYFVVQAKNIANEYSPYSLEVHTPIPPPPSPSPDCTSVTTVSSFIVDVNGTTWTIGSQTGPNGSHIVTTNPSIAAITNVFVRQLTYASQKVYMIGDDATPLWYVFDNGAIASSSAPTCGTQPPPPPPCTFSFGAAPLLAAAGGSSPVAFTVSASTCVWTATTTAPWLTVQPTSGTGTPNSFMLVATQNTGTATRSAQVLVGTTTLSVTQAAPLPSPTPCQTAIPAITIGSRDYDKSISLNAQGEVRMSLRFTNPSQLGSTVPPPRKIVSVEIRAETAPGVLGFQAGFVQIQPTSDSLVNLKNWLYTGKQRGSFNFVVWATDESGCVGKTSASRSFTVQ